MIPASISAPDVAGEGEIVCPCGNYHIKWRFHPAFDKHNAQRYRCPHCQLILEVWGK